MLNWSEHKPKANANEHDLLLKEEHSISNVQPFTGNVSTAKRPWQIDVAFSDFKQKVLIDIRDYADYGGSTVGRSGA